MKVLNLLVVFLSAIYCANGAKILGIFHTSSYSHFILGNALLKELAARGHEVTMISPFEQKPQIKNYKTILTKEVTEYFDRFRDVLINFHKMSHLEMMKMFNEFTYTLTELTLNSTAVQTLLKSNEKFDVLIIEEFLNEAFRGFQYHYDIPCITFSTVGMSQWINEYVGNPTIPSFMPNPHLEFEEKMTFFQRLGNTLFQIYNWLFQTLYRHEVHDQLLHKYFSTAPHISKMIYNTSLVLLNSVPGLNQPVPYLPNMIEVGGLHIKPPGKLPGDLQKFLDDSKEGVIYFSLGSNLKSKDLNADTKSAIIQSLSKLKMKVLWKFEEDLPNTPKNVKISKWFPQQDILAHPNVKLFITHGGLLSTLETLYHGKPILGIPHFGDQSSNMQKAVKKGYGLSIQPGELNEEILSAKLQELLTNPKYAKNAKAMSKILHDQPIKPAEKAAYWVEYVVRHNGAYHLRSSSLDLTWWQYSSLDVIGFCSAVLLTALCIIKTCLSCLCRKKSANKNAVTDKKTKTSKGKKTN